MVQLGRERARVRVRVGRIPVAAGWEPDRRGDGPDPDAAGLDAGHAVSCEEIATYPLVAATVSSTSAAVTISPALGGSLHVHQDHADLGRADAVLPGPAEPAMHRDREAHLARDNAGLQADCRRRQGQEEAEAQAAQEGDEGRDDAARARTRSPTGKSSMVTLSLNSTGKKLLTAHYTVPAAPHPHRHGVGEARRSRSRYGVIQPGRRPTPGRSASRSASRPS